MSDYLFLDKNPTLRLDDDSEAKYIERIAYALSSPERIAIMKNLINANKSLSAISSELDIPITTVTRHINSLAEAGLIVIDYQPGIKGHAKYCAHAIRELNIKLAPENESSAEEQSYSVEMPIGMFAHCHISAPCGLLGPTQPLIKYDDPKQFFTPERYAAELLWFNVGHISYNFPTEVLYHHPCHSISFSFEVCSETAYYNEKWPSDLSVFVNNIEVLTTTLPGDFGGRRGKFSPAYWSINSTQFGLLKNIKIDQNGVYENNILVRKDIKFDDLSIYKGNAVQLRLEIKKDAVHRGGINIFGKNFGDYNQAIVMTVK